MDNFMKALELVSTSWPIAAMVAAVTAGVVVRRSLRQAMQNDKEKHEAVVSQARDVTVPARRDR